jgi:hypothetical protein
MARVRRVLVFLGLGVFVAAVSPMALSAQAPASSADRFLAWAPTPPMGWNSWDAFGSTLIGPKH